MYRKYFFLRFLLIVVFVSTVIINGTAQDTDTQNDGDFGKITQNMSYPIEMATLIKESGVDFSMKYLCPTDVIDNYISNFDMALGLGFMGADLGYLNIYEKQSLMSNHIVAIRKFSDGLILGQFFDFDAFIDMVKNHGDINELLYMTVNSFNRMDQHLRTNNRGEISALLVSAVWIEGLYITTQVAKEYPNDELYESIGEQKIIIDELVRILEKYKNQDSNYQKFYNDFKDIQEAFKGINIEYTEGETQETQENGQVVFSGGGESNVNISEEQLVTVIKRISRVRNTYVKR